MIYNFKHNQITLIFAADIHKDKHHFLVSIKELRKTIHSFVVDNSTSGFNLFTSKLNYFAKKFNTHHIIFAFEPTSNYWMNFAYALSSHIPTSFLNKQIHFVSTEQVAYQRKADDPAGNKDDHLDPFTISKLVWDNKSFPAKLLDDNIRNLRETTRERLCYVKKRASLKLKLIDRLRIVFPEIIGFFSDILGASARFIISNFTSPIAIRQLSQDSFISQLRKISRKRLSVQKIESLYALSLSSMALKGDNSAIISHIKRILAQIEFYDNLISQLEDEIKHYLANFPQSLTQIKGISVILAAQIIAEIFPISRFSKSVQLVKLAGIDPTHSISGVSIRNLSHIAKKGITYLRLAIIQAAFSCIRHNFQFKSYYTNLINFAHKPKRVALVATANKLLRVIFVLLKYNVKFEQEKIGTGPKELVQLVPFDNSHSQKIEQKKRQKKNQIEKMVKKIDSNMAMVN